ncbi:MAG TPA: hypothetical protein VIS96_07165 [Terrimicrobiaceae bacterium]
MVSVLLVEALRKYESNPADEIVATLLREAMRNVEYKASEVGLSSDDLVGLDFYPICFTIHDCTVIPGELNPDEFEILKHKDGDIYLKAWTVTDEFDGKSWRQVPYMSTAIHPKKRKHHYSEPISRAEVVRLIHEHVIPDTFKEDFSHGN